MEIILIVAVVVLAVFIFWPKNKKPATPITKSRTSSDLADPEPETEDDVKKDRSTGSGEQERREK